MSTSTSRKVIFLLCQPLDERNFERFGIQLWRDKNWEVEIWDFTPFLFPQVWKNYIDENKSVVNDEFYYLIESKSILNSLLKRKEENGLFIDLIENGRFHYLRIKYIFFKRGMNCITLQLGSLPLPTVVNNLFSHFYYKIVNQIKLKKGVFFSDLAQYCIYKFYTFLYKRYFNQMHVAISGELSYEAAKRRLKNESNIIKAHNFDYDRFLRGKSILRIFDERYIVFLDEDMPYHSDFIYQKVKSPVTPEKYYSSLNKGLESISSLLRCEVKIAAHPRSNYTGSRSNSFNNSTLYKNSTDELVKSCEAVVCHCSASIQLAVLYNKPLIFVTTKELIESPYQIYIDNFAAELGTEVMNLDSDYDPLEWCKRLTIDEFKYLDYIKKYIKLPGTAERFSWDIICNYSNAILK